MQPKEVVDGDALVSLKIPEEQIATASGEEINICTAVKCGHWLGFWASWWFCWWAGFLISSVPATLICSLLSQKISYLFATGLRKLFCCHVTFSCCSSSYKHFIRWRDQEKNCTEEDLMVLSKCRHLMPGIVLGVIIGIFQVVNCVLRHSSVLISVFGIIFGFILMVINAHFCKNLI